MKYCVYCNLGVAIVITTGAISISQALMVNKTLLELYMAGNQIDDDGITAIAGSLSNSSITLLNVEECGISVVGVRSLAVAFQSIKKLYLRYNTITVDHYQKSEVASKNKFLTVNRKSH